MTSERPGLAFPLLFGGSSPYWSDPAEHAGYPMSVLIRAYGGWIPDPMDFCPWPSTLWRATGPFQPLQLVRVLGARP